MKNQPGMQAGLDVPFRLGNLLDDKKEQEKFKQNARNMLQK